MNAPYEGDRAQGTGGPAPSQSTAPGAPVPGQVPAPAPAPDHDPYVQDAYAYDPYRAQDLSAQDPVAEVLYDRASHPPPPPGTFQEPGPLYAAPPAPSYAPDPRVWAQTPPPEPDGPSRHLPYGDHATTTQFVGVDSLVTKAADQDPRPDAFAHLYRDQDAAPRTPAEDAPVAAPAPSKPAGRASSLLKSSALMAAGTIVSRITGFMRTLVIAGAIGVATLNDSYQVANTLPTMIYVLVGGGALNAVFIPQLVRAMKNDEDGERHTPTGC